MNETETITDTDRIRQLTGAVALEAEQLHNTAGIFRLDNRRRVQMVGSIDSIREQLADLVETLLTTHPRPRRIADQVAALARDRIDAGEYDDPEILDLAIDRMIDQTIAETMPGAALEGVEL